jgi:hypothetical protein
MNTLQEKTEIIARFKILNQGLYQIFNIEDIEQKADYVREPYVDLQLGDLFMNLYNDLKGNKTYEQIIAELSNSICLVNNVNLQFENKTLKSSTAKAIRKGTNYIINALETLKSETEEKLRTVKSKSKGKFDDVKVSEKEFALFIILAEKHGLISRVPKANEKAIAFSALTNISDQSLRDNIGSKYQLNPQELLLKKEYLTVLKETLVNICDEIDLIRDDLKY